MGEKILDLSAFREKKKEEKLSKEKTEKPAEGNIRNERLYGLSRINPERLELIVKIGRSHIISPTTEANAQEHFKNFTEDDLVSFINDASVANLKSKPTYLLVAFEKLKRTLLRKFQK